MSRNMALSSIVNYQKVVIGQCMELVGGQEKEHRRLLPMPYSALAIGWILSKLDASARMATGNFDTFRTGYMPPRNPLSVTA